MIFSSLGRFRDLGLLILRAGVGVMFVLHGWPKITGGSEMWTGLGGAMSNLGVTFAHPFWGFMAALAEFGGGILMILGLAFRPAALIMAFNMAVAALFHLNKGDGIQGASHAIELGIVFVSLFILGPGRYSVDRK